MRSFNVLKVAGILCCLVTPAVAQAPPATPTPQDHVAGIKKSLQTSMVALRQYQWVETTAVSMKGEEKSRTENNCYYGADGKVQKTPIAGEPQSASKAPRGIRGKIVENKKAEISDAMKEAIGLVKLYVPPDPAKIQAAKEAGKLSMTPPDAKGNMSVLIKDYLKPGDALTLSVNAAVDHITGIKVATFTDSTKDAVGLNVNFGAFADGTVYPATVNLDVKSQELAVAIENSGYKKLSN